MIKVLSREPERSMFGLPMWVRCCAWQNCILIVSYFSREVAKLVTQPEWPSRVPRSTSCSAMLAAVERGAVVVG